VIRTHYLYTQLMNETIQGSIQHYQPSPETVETVKNTKILLLVGIAGAGKDTIKKHLLEGGGYHHIVSHTTRPPRENDGVMERDGVEYHFVSIDEAVEMVQQRKFVEAKLVHGNTIYGTSAHELEVAKEANLIAMTDIDVQGVGEYKKISKHNAIAAFIVPPSYEAWMGRLSRRYGEDGIPEDERRKRTLTAVFELEHALSKDYYHFVVNDSVERAAAVANTLAHHQDTFNEIDNAVRRQAEQLLADIKAHL